MEQKNSIESTLADSLLQEVLEAAKQLSSENKEIPLSGGLPMVASFEEMPMCIHVIPVEINGEKRVIFVGPPTESEHN